VSAILRKLEVRNRTEAVAVAARLVTNVPMAIPVEREWDELTLEEQWQYLAGVPFAYRVHHVENPDA